MATYCPIADEVSTKSSSDNPAVLTINPPAVTPLSPLVGPGLLTPTPELEVCEAEAIITTSTGGGSSATTETETIIQGPPGPPGDSSLYKGLRWANDNGEWAAGEFFRRSDLDASPKNPNADVVRVDGALFVCKADHISEEINRPQLSTFSGPTQWQDVWMLMAEPGAAGEGTTSEQQSFIQNLTDGFFDWFKSDWSIGDWLLAASGLTGIVWAGSEILDMMAGDGSSGGSDADVRYNGSPSTPGDFAKPTIKTVVESLCIEAGIPQYDVSQLPTNVFCQFSLSQNTSVRNILDSMAKVYQFDIVDSSGILKFVPRGNSVAKVLTTADLGFNAMGDAVSPYATKRLQSVDLPRSITLSYNAEDLDFNKFSQRSELPTFTAGNEINIQVPFTITHDFAKSTTEKLLIATHLERTQYFFNTSYEHIDLEPGDVVSIPGAQVRIIQIEESDEGILQFTGVDAGVVTEPEPIIVGGVTIGYTASSYIGTNQAPQLPSEVINAAPEIGFSSALFIDPPALDADDVNPRVFAAVHGYGKAGWPGASIFKSIDGGASYFQIGSTSKSATIGLVAAATPSKDWHVWDDTTIITVQLKTGSLLSKTDTAVLAGENRCMIGQEVIGFGTANLIAPGIYQLSHLLRGRRGTEWAVSTHVNDELFVMLDDGLFEIEVAEDDRNKQYKFKIVTIGSDLTLADPITVQIQGQNTVPWTVGNPAIEKIGNDFKISWLPRPRFANAIRDYTEIPNDPDFSGFAVLIYATDGTTVKRQEIIAGKSFTYTSAQQLADFGSIQSNLKVAIATMSNRYGGGRLSVVNI